MEQRAKVCSIRENGLAQVMIVRESACSGDCHKCSGCGAVQQTVLIDAVNAIEAKPGEVVTIRSESGPVLAGAAMLYMVPLVLFFLGYLLGEQLQLGGLFGCIGFVMGFLPAVLYDRIVTAKKNAVYTITGYPAKASGLHTEGERHID